MFSILWINNFLLLILSLIFISSVFDKVTNYKKSISSISNYGFKETTAKILFFPLILCELFIAISSLILGINLINLIVICILLAIVSLAVHLNIRKGLTDMSCGCGGVLENERLSYSIIIRNISLVVLTIYFYFFDISLKMSILQFLILATLFFIISLIFSSWKYTKNFSERMEYVITKLHD